jgi:hypothetical protein
VARKEEKEEEERGGGGKREEEQAYVPMRRFSFMPFWVVVFFSVVFLSRFFFPSLSHTS